MSLLFDMTVMLAIFLVIAQKKQIMCIIVIHVESNNITTHDIYTIKDITHCSDIHN